MNNILIGNDRFAYYETVAGGQGARPGRDGQSGMHTGMTNTKNTPTESIEQHYPFNVLMYRLRPGSGGDGRYRGGDGIEREIEFEGELSDEQRLRLMEIADRCPVHRTLHGEIHVATRLSDID